MTKSKNSIEKSKKSPYNKTNKKHTMNKTNKTLSAVLTFMLSLGIGYAAWDSNKTTGDPLLSTDWNNMVNQVKGWTRASTLNTSDVYLGTTGNVGIGTSTPGSTLDVSGSANITGDLIVDSASTGDSIIYGHTTSVNALGNQGSAIEIHNNGNILAGYRYSADAGGTGFAGAKSRSGTIGTVGTIVQDGDNILTITGQGDDGSNLVTTAAKITIEVDGTPGSNDIPGAIRFFTHEAGQAEGVIERVTIDDAGNVGIGTTTPAAGLHVTSGALLNGPANTETAPSDAGTWFGFDGTNNVAQIQAINASTASMAFYTKSRHGAAPSESMRIKENGNVGIGTTSPGSKLSVVGLPSGTSDSVATGTLAGAVCITDAGNMYIDTNGSCAN